MSAMVSEITGVTSVYSAVCSGTDQRKTQSSVSLAFVRGIHQWPVNSSHKRPVTRNMFPFDDVIMAHERLPGCFVTQRKLPHISIYTNIYRLWYLSAGNGYEKSSLVAGANKILCFAGNTRLGRFYIHYSDVIISAMASQITGVTIVYLTVCSGSDQRKHQSSASLAFVRAIHRWPVNSPHKGPVKRKMLSFDDVIISGRNYDRAIDLPQSNVSIS